VYPTRKENVFVLKLGAQTQRTISYNFIHVHDPDDMGDDTWSEVQR
jgi:hypothetical protein